MVVVSGSTKYLLRLRHKNNLLSDDMNSSRPGISVSRTFPDNIDSTSDSEGGRKNSLVNTKVAQ